MASPVPTFQMMIWLSHPKMDMHSLSARCSKSRFIFRDYITQSNATEGINIVSIWSAQQTKGRLLNSAEVFQFDGDDVQQKL